MKSRQVKLQIIGINQNLKAILRNCAQQKNQFPNVTIKPTTDKQTKKIGRHLFCPDRIKDRCRPRHIRYKQAKLSGSAYKFEFIVNQDTKDSSDFLRQVVNPKKS